MIRAYQYTIRIMVVLIWVFLAAVVIEYLGQQIEFYRSMGGMF